MNNFLFIISTIAIMNLSFATGILVDKGHYTTAALVASQVGLIFICLIHNRRHSREKELSEEVDCLKNALAWETYKSLNDEDRVNVLKNMILPKVER